MSFNTPPSQPAITGDGWHKLRTALILIILAYALTYVISLGVRPMMFPDETRYGEVPREMLQSGDWVVPHIVDLRYFEKPPFGYWLTAVSISLFGENIFAVRLPSALASGLSAWLIWLLLVRSGVGRGTALVTAAVLLSFVETLIVGTTALLDSPFSLFLSAGMVLFYLAAREVEATRRQRLLLLATGVMFGIAFLTKGLLAIVLPGLVILPYCLLQRRYRLLWQCAWIALSGILTILPWAIAIHLREPDFWHYFIFEEHIRRFMAKNAQHTEAMYFYLMLLPLVTFPWSGFVPAAIAGLRSKREHKDLLRYLLLWFVMPLLFFSVSKGKLLTYILPCMVPAAAIIGLGLVNYLESGRRRLFLLGVSINAFVLLLALSFLLYSHYHVGAKAYYQADESVKLFTLLCGMGIAALLTIYAALKGHAYRGIATVAASTAVMLIVMNGSLPAHTLAIKSPVRLFEQVAHKLKPDTIIVSDGNGVRAVAWTLKRTDIYLLSAGELFYGLRHSEHRHRWLKVAGLRKLLAQQQHGELKQDIAVFCELTCSKAASELLRPVAQFYTNGKFSVWLVPYGKQ